MISTLHCWPLLLAALSVPAWSAPPAMLQVATFNPSELRRAVEAHRADQREETRREEAAAGRHLTAGELAELREQVRRQWAPAAAPSRMQDTRRNIAPSAPTQTAPERAPTSQRSQRP